jgi:hypothetical protein
MEVVNIAAQQLLDELTKSKVVVTFSDKVIKDTGEVFPKDGGESFTFDTSYRPFTISINDEFFMSYEDLSFELAPNYIPHLERLRDNVISEIETNINLRIGKWDILNYLTNLQSELQEIRNKFGISEIKLQSEGGIAFDKSDIPIPEGGFPDYDNSNIEIVTKVKYENDQEDQEPPDFCNDEIFKRDFILARYWDIQVLAIERLLRFIEPRRSLIEKTDDYAQKISALPTQFTLQWTKSDTDLLELIIALLEVGAIQNATKDLTQKEAIQVFSDFFGKEIKDQYKKLNAARNRKKEDPGFIIKLQKALDTYYQCLNERS